MEQKDILKELLSNGEQDLSPQENLMEEFRIAKQEQQRRGEEAVARGLETDADVDFMNALNKAGAQANQALSSGYANIKVNPVDFKATNYGKTASDKSEKKIQGLLDEYKLLDKREARTAKAKAKIASKVKTADELEKDADEKALRKLNLDDKKYKATTRGKEKELTPYELEKQALTLDKMKYDKEHRGEVSEYDEKEQAYKNRLLDSKIANEGKVSRNTKYMNTPAGLVEIDENTGKVKVIQESSLRKDREERLAGKDKRQVEREVQRQKERVSNEIISLRKTLNKDPRFLQITKEGMSFDQVDNLAKLAEEGNQTAFGALGTKMARAMGEVGVLTDADVVRYVRGGSLSRKAADVLNTWKEGRPSKASISDIKEISRVLKEIHGTRIAPLYNEFAKTAYENLPISKYEAYKRLSMPIPPSLKRAKVFFKKNKAKLNKMGINSEREAEAYLKEQGKL